MRTATKRAASDEAAIFHATGWIARPSLLSTEEIDPLREEYDAAFNADAGRELAVPGARMRQITNLGKRSPAFRRLWTDERIVSVFRTLLGPHLQLWHDQALWKPARDGGAVFWHQDNAYWHLSPPNAASCWIALDDADADNGAMQVVPGSHRTPVAHAAANGTTALLDAGTQVDPAQAVVVDLPAGGCLFHHCQTLHYTAPNRTDRQRRAFIIHVVVPGTGLRDGTALPVDDDHPIISR